MADEKQPMPAVVAAMLADGQAKLAPIEAPAFHATGMNVLWGNNSCTIVLSRGRPIVHKAGDVVNTGMLVEPIAVIHFSPQTAKDMAIILTNTVAKYEQDWGKITTEYSRKVEKDAQTTARKSKKAARSKK